MNHHKRARRGGAMRRGARRHGRGGMAAAVVHYGARGAAPGRRRRRRRGVCAVSPLSTFQCVVACAPVRVPGLRGMRGWPCWHCSLAVHHGCGVADAGDGPASLAGLFGSEFTAFSTNLTWTLVLHYRTTAPLFLFITNAYLLQKPFHCFVPLSLSPDILFRDFLCPHC